MAKRRVRLSSKEYQELVEAHDWCAQKGFEGFKVFYDQLLTDLYKRRSLPPEAYDHGERPEED